MKSNLLPDDLPDKKFHVLLAVLSISLICAVLYWIDFSFVAGPLEAGNIASEWKLHSTIIRAVIENLIAGAVAALLLALVFRWIVIFIDPRDRVIELPQQRITDRLLRNALRTRSYIFLGNTATFVSSTILPVLCDTVRKNGQPRTITLVLINPMDDASVASYSAFKLGVKQAASKVADKHLARWVQPLDMPVSETSEEIKGKVLAAIYLAAYSSLQSGMAVSVFLRNSFTPFRADISDDEVVLTQESSDESAVAFSSSGHFYGWYHKEADAQCIQGFRLDIAGQREELRKLPFAHPNSSNAEIKIAIYSLVKHFQYLNLLSDNEDVISIATKRVSSPNHVY